MAFVSITRLRIRSLRFMPMFLFDTLRTLSQVKRAGGFLGGSLLGDRDRTFWTATLWAQQTDMRAYMASGAHLKAMPKLLNWCDEASVVHWTQDAELLPSWQDADARMRAEGRPSKVRKPSATHRHLGYRAPRTTGAIPIRPRSKTPLA